MPGYQEDREAERESIVQIIVVDDDGGAKDDPYRNDNGSRELGLASGFGGNSGDRGRENGTLCGFSLTSSIC